MIMRATVAAFGIMLVQVRACMVMGVNPIGPVAVKEIRVVVAMRRHPLEKVWLLPGEFPGHRLLVFLQRGVGLEMEVVVKFSVRAAEGQDALLAGESAMVDIRGTPEIPARGQVAELHHP